MGMFWKKNIIQDQILPKSELNIQVAAGRKDVLTGQKRNRSRNVSFSNKKSVKWQQVNLQNKKIFWDQGQRFVRLRIAARTIRTIEKNGLSALARRAGINLWNASYEDVRPDRLDYLAKHPLQVPRRKNPSNKMSNPKRLDASKKQPLAPCYIDGSVFWVPGGREQTIYKLILAQKETDLIAQIALRSAESVSSSADSSDL